MAIDQDVVTLRLSHMSELLSDLHEIGPVSDERLAKDRLLRHAVERILGQLVDLAVSINTHLGVALNQSTPKTYRDSFATVARTGAIEPGLAARLAPSAGLRNILIHEYVEIDPEIVSMAVPQCLIDYSDYVSAVASWLAAQDAS